MKHLVAFVIHLDHSVRKTDLKDYLRDAVESWQGALCPGTDEQDADPMWNNVQKVTSFKIRDLT